MSAINRPIRDDDRRNDPDPPAAAPAHPAPPNAAGPPFDWQVLLLRYLPQPVGSAHAVKRLAPR